MIRRKIYPGKERKQQSWTWNISYFFPFTHFKTFDCGNDKCGMNVHGLIISPIINS